MRGTLLICGKDLRQRLRDRSAFIMGIGLPLALALIFNVLLSGVVSGSPGFKFAIADEDHSQISAGFAEELRSLQGQGIVKLTQAPSAAEATRWAASGKVDAAFVVPAGFSQAVTGGTAAAVQVIGNANATVAAQAARSIAESYAAGLTATGVALHTAIALSGTEPAPAQLAQMAAAAAAVASPVSIRDISAQRHELDAKTYYAAGMAVLFLFFTVSFGVIGLLDERKEGTLARLLAAPIRRGSVLAGKLASSFVVGVLAMGVLIGATSLLMGARWGNPVGVGMLVVAGVLAGIGLAALVATLSTSAEQAGNLLAVTALVLGALGGTFFPIGRVGGFLSRLSLLTPHAWFLRGLGDLASGAGPSAAIPATLGILAFALVTGAIAATRLSKAVRL